MDHSAPDLKSLLTKTQLKDLIAKQTKPLVALGHRVTIGTVLETLSEHGLLSAPIFIADEDGDINPSVATLIGFVDTWTVLAAFLQSLGNTSEATEEWLESQGAALCARPVLDLFEGGSAVRAAVESGDVKPTCADWDTHDDPNSSLPEVIRSCFLPRAPGNNSLSSWQSGAGFSLSAAAALAGTITAPSPRASAVANPAAAAAAANGSSPTHPVGHSRHPAASHRILVVNPEADVGQQLSVLSQSDVLRFLAAHHDSLRPLGKASLAELGLATGSLHLAAGPPATTMGPGARPPPLTTPGGSGGSNNSLPPSSPKPPLAGGLYSSSFGGGSGGAGSLLGSLGASPVQESHMINFLQRANSSGSGGGPTAMQMSPPASPRVSMDRLDRLSASLHACHSFGGHHGSSGGHRMATRRQLVAVHESVSALEAFRVLLQQRVSAVAVLAGVGSSVNMRLVNNLSASDLRHLKKGSFGRLALSVKQFLASKPAAPDQAIALKGPSVSPPPATPGSPTPAPRTSIVMAHAPGVYTCQATASLEELVKMLGAPHHGIHRVYVVDPDQRPAGVVTGTDVLSLLSAACSRE